MSNKVIIKNGQGAPTAEALGKAELGFDTLNEWVYVGRENNSPLCISPEIKVDLDGAAQGNASLTNADTLNGKPAHYYGQATKLTPRNLLDNSDFTNPVNQRGKSSSNNGYTIDRWCSSNTNVNVIVGDGKITLSKSKTGGTFCQYLPFDVTGKNLTLAINTSIGLLLWSGVSDGDDLTQIDGLNAYFGVKVSNGITQVLIYFNNSDTIEFDLYWAALYEGEYTVDTLPEYQPKGYGAELAECQRYYRKFARDGYGTYLAGGLCISETNVNFAIHLDKPMRIAPTVSFNGSFAINSKAFKGASLNAQLALPDYVEIRATSSELVVGYSASLQSAGSNSSIELSADL